MKSSNFASNFIVSGKNSDQMVLHVPLTCERPYPERKEIFVRSLKRINDDALLADFSDINIDMECRDVNSIVNHYEISLSAIIDEHALLKKICIVDIPINDDIQALKVNRRNKEDILRKNLIVNNFEIDQKSCLAVKMPLMRLRLK